MSERGSVAADRAAAAGDIVRARTLLADLIAAEPDMLDHRLKLAAMCRAAGDALAALDAVHGALALAPLDFTALLLRATLLERLGDATADEAFARAVAQKPQGTLPPALAAVLARAEHRAAMFVAAREARLPPARASLSIEQAKRVERFRSNIVRRTRPFHSEPTHYHYPGLVEREFHDRSLFPWLTVLEAATAHIATEFHAIAGAKRAELVPYIRYAPHEPLDRWRALNHSTDWTAIHLLQNGCRVEANAAHCPRTMALLETLPQPRIAGCSPNAMFSLLAPGVSIPPHVGIANTRLVCHLPLIVPEGCWFRVGAERRGWSPGEAFVFDDTIEHEAANPSDQLRVVFIVDVWHPGLDADERAAVGAIMAADVGGAGQSL